MPKHKRIKPVVLRTLEELKKSGTVIHALIYCRVSSERQVREGGGLGTQEQRCREYANLRGYQVDRVFCDTYTGGGDYMDRPDVRELFAFLDDHPFHNYIIIF